MICWLESQKPKSLRVKYKNSNQLNFFESLLSLNGVFLYSPSFSFTFSQFFSPQVIGRGFFINIIIACSAFSSSLWIQSWGCGGVVVVEQNSGFFWESSNTYIVRLIFSKHYNQNVYKKRKIVYLKLYVVCLYVQDTTKLISEIYKACLGNTQWDLSSRIYGNRVK